MIAYKGFEKNISCRSYQLKRYGINETTEANCRQNGFHCAENPLDCLFYYGDVRQSEYYIVDAGGDIDEDNVDSKIACTELKILRKLEIDQLILHGFPVLLPVPVMPIPLVHLPPVCDLQMKYQIFQERSPCFWIFSEEGSLFFHSSDG